MEYEEILEKVMHIVAEIYGVPEENLTEETRWKEDLGVDLINSIQCREFVDMKVAIDDEFETDCPNMKLGRCKTMGDVAAFVADLIEE